MQYFYISVVYARTLPSWDTVETHMCNNFYTLYRLMDNKIGSYAFYIYNDNTSLPMLKKSTSSSTVGDNRTLASDKKDECLKPCESTLAIIRQFARAYHFERALAPRHAAVILN